MTDTNADTNSNVDTNMGPMAHPAVQEAIREEYTVPEEELAQTESWIRKKILHVLAIYPKVSGAMLQIGIGPSIAPKIWRPVYERLKSEGIVKEEHVEATSPSDRIQTYKVISLVKPA